MESLFTKKVPLYFETEESQLILGDSFKILTKMKPESVDMIFADPPYFLSNDGITCQGGKMVSVNKGSWDKLSESGTSVEETKALPTSQYVGTSPRTIAAPQTTMAGPANTSSETQWTLSQLSQGLAPPTKVLTLVSGPSRLCTQRT